MRLVLTIVSGPFGKLNQSDLSQLLHWIRLDQSLQVGRSGFGADMRVRQDAKMSGTHFEVYGDGKDFRIRDLQSTNGTFVDGLQVTESLLRHGDIIQAGDTTFRVALLGQQNAPGVSLTESDGASPLVPPTTEEPSFADPSDATDHRSEDQAGLIEAEPSALGGGSTTDPPAAPPRPPVPVAPPSSVDKVAVQAMRVVVRIQSGPFGDVERANMTRLLHWIGRGQSLRFGRGHDADFVIRQDKSMSSQHFEVHCDGELCTLRDLGSSNGTLVNGLPVTQTQLHDGDAIKAGATTFTVTVVGGREPVRQAVEADSPEKVSTSELVLETQRIEAAPDTPVDPAGQLPMQVVLNIVVDAEGPTPHHAMSRVLAWIRAGQTITVGRHSSGADMIVAHDNKMSTPHFEVVCDGKKCHLRDLDSRNGTFLNGIRVRVATLRDGNEILAGNTMFRVSIQGGQFVSDTAFEFSRIEAESDDADEQPPAPDVTIPDMDAVFSEIKEKLSRRKAP